MEDFKEKKFKFFINLFSLNFHQFLLGKWEKKYFNIFSFSFFMLYIVRNLRLIQTMVITLEEG